MVILFFGEMAHHAHVGVGHPEFAVEHGEKRRCDCYPDRDVKADGELKCKRVRRSKNRRKQNDAVLEREHADDRGERAAAVHHKEGSAENGREEQRYRRGARAGKRGGDGIRECRYGRKHYERKRRGQIRRGREVRGVFPYQAEEERRRHDALHAEREEGRVEKTGRLLGRGEHNERDGDRERLHEVERYQRRVLAHEVHDEREQKHKSGAQREYLNAEYHTTMRRMAITLKTNEVKRRSGTRKKRNFAIPDSMSAIAARMTSAFNAKNKNASPRDGRVSDCVMPHGAKTLPRIMTKIRSLLAEAHSMSASFGPEYSRIIASCTIVSSRCVAGLSTG